MSQLNAANLCSGEVNLLRLPDCAKCQGTVTSVSGGTGLSGTVTGSGSLALSQATTSALGGIIVGTGLSVNSGTVCVTNLPFSADGCKNGVGQAGYVCPAGLCTNYCAAVSSANAFVGCSTNNCVDVTTVKASTLVDVSSGTLSASCIDVGTQTATGLITALKLCTTGTDDCVETSCLKGDYDAADLIGTIDAARLPATAKCQGDITQVIAGAGLGGGGATGNVSLCLNLGDVNDSTTNSDGACFAVVNSSNVQKLLAKGSINISGFNNDSNFTSNTGTLTSSSNLNASRLASGTVDAARLPIASTSCLGGVKFGCECTQSTAASTFTECANKSYAVTPNSTNQMVVNVPWTDTNTTYSAATMCSCVGITSALGTNAFNSTAFTTCTGTVTGVGSKADDVLGVNSGSICAIDAAGDKIVFWDNSVNCLRYLTVGSNLSISGTTISASASGGGATTSASGWTKPTTTTDGLCVGSGECVKGPILCATTCVQVAGNATISCSGSNPTGWLKLSAGCGVNDICGNTATGSGFYWAYCDGFNTVPAWMNSNNAACTIYLGSSISDYRIKQNLCCWSALCCSTNVLKQIPVYSFNWNSNRLNETTSTPRVGFLAHEVKDALGDVNSLVTVEKDATHPDGSINPQQISDLGLIPILWSALQETIKKVEALESEVEALKNN